MTKSSYQKLNEKCKIMQAYNKELEHLILRMGTNEQNIEFGKLQHTYIKLIENLKK